MYPFVLASLLVIGLVLARRRSRKSLGSFISALPPELIELIVERVDDVASLKSLSLTTSAFRIPCQKYLLQYLHLSLVAYDPRRGKYLHKTYAEVDARFEHYPHLAGYVSQLFIDVDIWSGADKDELDAGVRAAGAALHRLTNVKNLTILSSVLPDLWEAWDRLPLGLTDAVLYWLELVGHGSPTGTLRDLTVANIARFSPAAIQRFLAAAPSVTLEQLTVIEEDAAEGQASIPAKEHRSVERLSIHGSPSVTALFLRPEFLTYAHSLRALTLGLGVSFDAVVELCSANADTLEYLHLHSSNTFQVLDEETTTNLALRLGSPLSRLRHLCVSLSSHYLEQHTDSVSIVLPAFLTPAFTHLTLDVPIIPKHNAGVVQKHTFSDRLLSAFDTALCEHPALTTVCWRPDIRVFPGDRTKPMHFSAFCKAITEGMPGAFAKGLFVFSGAPDQGFVYQRLDGLGLIHQR
ncbi:hypothetical protein C8F01DRAFT_1164993 [Mycena amicta]|nr:hypothetical protein C8F01DRAFT_1171897 [Mycena amicta]KAJ7053850.1 hypothetical protein C8F01DRAFT_1164993 [Mycena amicta]